MQINTNQFNYHAASGTFTAEASTLGNQFDYSYNGIFELVSHRTGKVVEMRLVQRHYDREGDLTHWEFKPINCESFKNLIVFND